MPSRCVGDCRHNSMHSLTVALYVGGWSASHPCCITPRERAPSTQIGGLYFVVKRKIPFTAPASNLTPVIQPMA